MASQSARTKVMDIVFFIIFVIVMLIIESNLQKRIGLLKYHILIHRCNLSLTKKKLFYKRGNLPIVLQYIKSHIDTHLEIITQAF